MKTKFKILTMTVVALVLIGAMHAQAETLYSPALYLHPDDCYYHTIVNIGDDTLVFEIHYFYQDGTSPGWDTITLGPGETRGGCIHIDASNRPAYIKISYDGKKKDVLALFCAMESGNETPNFCIPVQ
jgi:hypothetical protein